MEENIFVVNVLQAFKTEEQLKYHIKDCFKINGKQTIKMPKKGEYITIHDLRQRWFQVFESRIL